MIELYTENRPDPWYIYVVAGRTCWTIYLADGQSRETKLTVEQIHEGHKRDRLRRIL